MKHLHFFQAWGQTLQGRRPVLSLEITNRCPLSCPGCYAYQPAHVSGSALESMDDFKGDDLVKGVLNLVDERRLLGLFLVGGEPLVKVRELNVLLPEVCRRGIEVEVVTSGIVRIPAAWMQLSGLKIAVSIDGLQPQHDRRRAPATYARILKNIEDRRVLVHCTITRQMAKEAQSLEQFMDFWTRRPEVEEIRMSLYTPQVGEASEEILTPDERILVVSELDRLGRIHKKLRYPVGITEAYLNPPQDPLKCMFARVTENISADLKTPVLPCSLGGDPDCRQCGCFAAIGLQALSRYRLPGGISVGRIFRLSDRIGGISRLARRKFWNDRQ